MACKIIYKGISYDESDFKSQIERYIAINNLFNENETLANEVYEALGFKTDITQDNKSYYRGQLNPFKLDKDGNLILEPQYAGWQEEISYDKHKGMGISLSPNLSLANSQGNMFYEGKISKPQDEGWMDEREAEDWLTNTINEGYYIVQISKNYIKNNFKDIFDNEDYEQRIGTSKPIVIPKGQFKIENIKPDLVEGEDYNFEITPEQKQKAQQVYSSYLQTTNNPNIEGFKQWNNRQQQINELFESNLELANQVYEALGFDNVITSTDKIVWGHPAIGKTTMLESNPNVFIDWDNEFNIKRDNWIASKSNTKIGTPEFKKARNEYMINYNNHKDYVAFVKEEWNKAKEKANKENKTLIASPHMLLNLFPNDFDKVITMSDKIFMDRAIKRSEGDEVNSKLWKEGINKTLQSIDKSKIIETDKFINDLFITPEQKQQAQQKFQEYVNTTGRQDIEGFKEFVNNKSSQVENIEVDGVPNINNEEKSLKLALKGLTPEEKISFCNHFGITMTEENGKKC